MNKTKHQLEKRRGLNLFKHTSLSGNKEGHFCAYASESEEHMDMKYSVWKKLKKASYSVWCEPILKTGGRLDILAYKDGIWTNYEILSSENLKELNSKIKKYPSEINVIAVTSQKDIKNLEMF